MTTAVEQPTTPKPRSADVPEVAPRRNRLLLVAVTVASVIPFYWAAIRDARNGFYPTLDIAATVTRARAVFSDNPPLIGMWSSGSSWSGHEIHFPGAIQLYLMAGPIHLLGNTWGPLLAMATINAAWVLLAIWLFHRRLGTNAALVGSLFLMLFIWSIGSENLVDPRPMEMVTIPFLCFLFAVWLVAAGDIDAIPALAVVANYLYLDHLVMVLQIPIIGLCAVAGVIYWVIRARARKPPGDDPWWRPLRRRLLQGLGISLVMWLPSLIQEVRNNPGNLTLLVRSAGHDRDAVNSLAVGYNAVIRLISIPDFWFRGRFDDPAYIAGIESVGVPEILGGIALVSVITVLGLLAWRRRDALGVAALAVSVVGIAISIVTVVQAPARWGLSTQYLRSLWGLAAFVWFAVFFNLYRLLRPQLKLRAATASGIGALLVAIPALSYANYGAVTDIERSPLARQIVNEVVPALEGRGNISVRTRPDFMSQRFYASLLLGLDTAGIHYCVSEHDAQQYGREHLCHGDTQVVVWVAPLDERPDIQGKVLARVPMLTASEKRRYEESRRTVRRWLAERDSIEVPEEAERFIDTLDLEQRRAVEQVLSPPNGDLVPLMESGMFKLMVGLAQAHQTNPDDGVPIFADPDAPIAAMSTYFTLRDRADSAGAIWVIERSAT